MTRDDYGRLRMTRDDWDDQGSLKMTEMTRHDWDDQGSLTMTEMTRHDQDDGNDYG